MKYIINNGMLIDAETSWQDRMGLITPQEFADQIGGQLVTVSGTYNPRDITIDCFTVSSTGVYKFSASLYNEIVNSKKLDYIRRKRAFECFRIVNRGPVWYNTLTESQKQDIQNWYDAWLALPNREDLNIDSPQYPTPPSWLQGFITLEEMSAKVEG